MQVIDDIGEAGLSGCRRLKAGDAEEREPETIFGPSGISVGHRDSG